MSCPQCFSGHVNPGAPTGRWNTVHGLRTYIAEPPAGKSAKAIIVIIPDAFGVGFVNNQILADHYASAADYLVYLPDFMDAETKLASGHALADAVFTAHPSSVDAIPDIGNVARPLSIAIGDDDPVMGMKQVRQAQSILEGKDVDTSVVIYPRAKHGFSIRASRAEPDSKETRQAEEAEEQAIAWFKKQFSVVV
ncbi:dienelactone hydrolase family [Fusarium subglutinans]|uniref:Dienelactone hydrolase family n=1 Tax=Gibberella subglutinans TaxID=42677 RepID=A0A8H5P1F1_GIBSU|nr:dienelactone hydrolase family [Fusarium subglutinans]KAF5584633.1 dienelactone hydrolase family [Fusarium subglutinans]